MLFFYKKEYNKKNNFIYKYGGRKMKKVFSIIIYNFFICFLWKKRGNKGEYNKNRRKC